MQEKLSRHSFASSGMQLVGADNETTATSRACSCLPAWRWRPCCQYFLSPPRAQHKQKLLGTRRDKTLSPNYAALNILCAFTEAKARAVAGHPQRRRRRCTFYYACHGTICS